MGIVEIKKKTAQGGVYIPEINVFLDKAVIALVSDNSGRQNVRIEGQNNETLEAVVYYYFSTMLNPNSSKADDLYSIFN